MTGFVRSGLVSVMVLMATGFVLLSVSEFVAADRSSAEYGTNGGTESGILSTTPPSPTTTPSPPTESNDPVVVVMATETPPPFKAPKADPTPFPTCPADRAGVTCYKHAETPTPAPVPTYEPPPFCDVAPVETWCVTRLTPTPER